MMLLLFLPLVSANILYSNQCDTFNIDNSDPFHAYIYNYSFITNNTMILLLSNRWNQHPCQNINTDDILSFTILTPCRRKCQDRVEVTSFSRFELLCIDNVCNYDFYMERV